MASYDHEQQATRENAQPRKIPSPTTNPIHQLPDPAPQLWWLPPQEGAKQKVLGSTSQIPAYIQVVNRDVNFIPAKAVAWKTARSQGAKIKLGDQSGEGLTKEIPFVAHDIEYPEANPQRTTYKEFTIKGDLYIAQSPQQTIYLTNDPNDPAVLPNTRAIIASFPGGKQVLQFSAVPHRERNNMPENKKAIKVLAYGAEEIKLAPGNYLTKAVLVVPTHPDGTPEDGILTVCRTFFAKSQPQASQRAFVTPKYIVDISKGEISIIQIDGLSAVRAARKEEKEKNSISKK